MADKLPWGLKNAGLTPGSAKKISENKLKAFNMGAMGVGKKSLSKREQEEIRRKQDEEAAANVYEEFVASFEDAAKGNKTWVKGGTVNLKSGDSKRDSGRLYKPASKLAELASTFQSVKAAKKRNDYDTHSPIIKEKESLTSLKKKKGDEKKKSNLEIFKEELKQIQEERQERYKLKRGGKDEFDMPDSQSPENRLDPYDDLDLGIVGPKGTGDPGTRFPYDPGDENTTNIYVGNINPKMSEQQLCEAFGRYGPLASIKIMWPRSEEERARGRNCGFVAFMNRQDGERAMNTLREKPVMGYDMKLGWGKAVPIPPHPIYIPPALAELTMPPPPSGLPFNAQPTRRRRRNTAGFPPPEEQTPEEMIEFEKTLSTAVVKVVIPTDRGLLCVIHRMIEFVVREGPMFEAMIMNREINNQMFKFLFENKTPAHVYYRWKLYSILQGEAPYKWRAEEFRMFKNGSYWRPPPLNPYTQGMPDELVQEPTEGSQRKGQLTDSQRDRLEDMLRELSPERQKIGEVMVWCLDHAESADEVVECISESLSIMQTPLPKKIARLFLVSDILFNCSAKVPNASFYRKCFQTRLVEIFQDVHETYVKIDGRLKAEQFKQKVMACFRAWEDWAIYPNDFLIKLQNLFLGLVITKTVPVAEPSEVLAEVDLDGAPISDMDGSPMAARPGERDAEFDGKPRHDDTDGEPLNDVDGEPMERSDEMDGKAFVEEDVQSKFVVSKWESVNETDLEAQAMTTSKWDLLDQQSEEDQPTAQEDYDGQPMEEEASGGTASDDNSSARHELIDPHQRQIMTEERRAKLREIEMKVVKYQDELEVGKRSRKQHLSIHEQIHHYRKKLLQKADREEIVDSPTPSPRVKRRRSRSATPPSYRSLSGSPKRSRRNKSPKRSRRSRSRSPSSHKRSLSRSPSRHRHKHKKKYRD